MQKITAMRLSLLFTAIVTTMHASENERPIEHESQFLTINSHKKEFRFYGISECYKLGTVGESTRATSVRELYKDALGYAIQVTCKDKSVVTHYPYLGFVRINAPINPMLRVIKTNYIDPKRFGCWCLREEYYCNKDRIDYHNDWENDTKRKFYENLR